MNGPAAGRLLRAVSDIAGPALTWYSTSGERIELSGPVLARWASKTAHLLLDLDAVPGERVLVDAGTAWRVPAVWLAAWHLGLEVVEPPAAPPAPDLAVVADGAPVPDGVDPERVVVLARAAMAVRAEHVPPDAVDYAAVVASFPDAAPPAGPDPGVTLDAVGPGRVLLGPGAGARDLAAVWAGGGSVVWHDGLTGPELDRISTVEHVSG